MSIAKHFKVDLHCLLQVEKANAMNTKCLAPSASPVSTNGFC